MLSKTVSGLINATGFINVTTSETMTAHVTKKQPVSDTGQFWARLHRRVISCVMSVCLFACISAVLTGRISVKFNTGNFYENL